MNKTLELEQEIIKRQTEILDITRNLFTLKKSQNEDLEEIEDKKYAVIMLKEEIDNLRQEIIALDDVEYEDPIQNKVVNGEII